MISSMNKIIKYLQCVSTKEMTIEVNGETFNMPANTSIKLSDSIWHRDYCLCCGQCCRNYDTVFSVNEFEEVKKLAAEGSEPHATILATAQLLDIKIDDTFHHFYSVPPMTSKDSHGIMVNTGTVLNCRWIAPQPDGRKFCKIHEYRTITCGFPHLEFRGRPGATPGLHHIQFGRNHQLGCKVDINEPSYDEATLQDDIYWLSRLKDFADEYGIPTMLDSIISVFKSVEVTNPPTNSIVLSAKHSILFKGIV